MAKGKKEQRLGTFVDGLFGASIDQDGQTGRTVEERFMRTAVRSVIRQIHGTWVQRLHSGVAAGRSVYMAIMAVYALDHEAGKAMLTEYESSRTDPVGKVLRQMSDMTGQPLKLIERTPVGGYAPEPDDASMLRMKEHIPEDASVSADDLETAFKNAVTQLIELRNQAIADYAAEEAAKRDAAKTKREEEARKAEKQRKKSKKKRKTGKAPKKRKETRVEGGLQGLGAALSDAEGEN